MMALPLLNHVRRWVIARAIRRKIYAARNRAIFDRMFGPGAADIAAAGGAVSVGRLALQPAPVAKAALTPGRQHIAMPMDLGANGPFAINLSPWKPTIPAGAKSAWWEDLHTFAPGARPKRHEHFGLTGQEPPLSMTCVACELEQTPLRISEPRKCPYCGIIYRLHGSRVFWWREAVEVTAWEASPRQANG